MFCLGNSLFYSFTFLNNTNICIQSFQIFFCEIEVAVPSDDLHLRILSKAVILAKDVFEKNLKGIHNLVLVYTKLDVSINEGFIIYWCNCVFVFLGLRCRKYSDDESRAIYKINSHQEKLDEDDC